MTFSAATAVQQINESMNSMLLLHSSCQALIEVDISPVASQWYDTLNRELGEAEGLVVDWRQNGMLYFQQDVVARVVSCGHGFVDAKAAIDALFEQLENAFSQATRDKIVARLNALDGPVSGMVSEIDAYLSKLAAFEKQMQVPHSAMNKTIAQIQAQESAIQAEIATLNSQIDELGKHIVIDRKAIAAAEKQRTEGIVETIFGVLLAPLTGGASLVLAGIGVATIAEAQQKVDDMHSTISRYQGRIASDQSELSDDQKEIGTLKGLSMSTQIAIADMSLIAAALDALRVSWTELGGELSNAAGDVGRATTAAEAVVGQAWFDAAVGEWRIIIPRAESLLNRYISSTRVQIPPAGN